MLCHQRGDSIHAYVTCSTPSKLSSQIRARTSYDCAAFYKRAFKVSSAMSRHPRAVPLPKLRLHRRKKVGSHRTHIYPNSSQFIAMLPRGGGSGFHEISMVKLFGADMVCQHHGKGEAKILWVALRRLSLCLSFRSATYQDAMGAARSTASASGCACLGNPTEVRVVKESAKEAGRLSVGSAILTEITSRGNDMFSREPFLNFGQVSKQTTFWVLEKERDLLTKTRFHYFDRRLHAGVRFINFLGVFRWKWR